MAHKRTDASTTASSRGTDDFTRIKGIGTGIGNRLHSYGIRTYAQLAALPAETIAALLPNLSAKQVIKNKWIHEAAKLASDKSETSTSLSEPSLTEDRQHYENFTFEFLLDRKNKIRRIQVVHVQSGDVDTWTKWDPERLIDFLARHAGARLSYSKPVLSSIKELPLPAVVETNAALPVSKSEEPFASPRLPAISELTPQIHAPEISRPPGPEPLHLPSPSTSMNSTNKINLLEWKTSLENTDQPTHHLSHDQAFDVKLTFDLTPISLPDDSQLDFTASLFAKKLGDGMQRAIAETKQILPYANTMELTIGHATLPQGIYRLEALLTLIDPICPNRPRIQTSFQGGLVQVY